MCVLGQFSCVYLFAILWTVGCSVLGILQTKILEWIAMPSSRGRTLLLPNPGIEPTSLALSPALAGRFFTTSATWASHIKEAN